MLPFIEIFGEKVPSYLLIISFAYCFAILYLLVRVKGRNLEEKYVLDSALVLMISGFIGSRLFHVFYEYPNYYLENPLRIFYVWQGGFVFLGGAILSYFTMKFFAKIKNQSWQETQDLYAPVIILCYSIGRLSCLAAGCCYGKACALPWAIEYPAGVEAPHAIGLHPTPIYASLFALFHWVFLTYLDCKKRFLKKPGDLFYIALVIHSIGRIMMELFRADHRGPSFGPVSVSLAISLVLLAWGIYKYRKVD